MVGRFIKTAALGLALPFVTAANSSAACSLALVLAMDVSASVNDREHDLQLKGLSGALTDPSVMTAIRNVGGIWLTSFEWSGRYNQISQIDWRFVRAEDEIHAAADQIAAQPRSQTEFPTALGHALGHASILLQNAPETCARKVIDVAGDGINNEGFGPASAYGAFRFSDVTVNGLVIAEDQDTERYYLEEVIHGPGAFVEVTRSFEDYRDAMTRKLLREIRGDQFASIHH
ncbi:DUF1194 domain-containing protein [Roseibium sediminis]|uniref:DUF1194 domain-containing protein n=1 Tax=Roseibium sediminis TaxID=1775174 RepID=UPI00123DFF75|nr:DUF1194 domain-containing protein [Roseibium sediminis]